MLLPEQLALWRGLPIGWFEAGPAAHGRNFLVPRPLLGLLEAGEAEASFDFGKGLRTYRMSQGAIRVFDGVQACRRNDWACRSARRIMVELDGAAIGEPELLRGLRQDLEVRDADMAGVVRAMAAEVSTGCPHGALYAECLSTGLLLRLAQTHGSIPQERGALSAAQMHRIDDCIAAHAREGGPTLEQLARECGFSRAQFVRLFRRTKGTSPHRYVMQWRLDRARAMVENTALSFGHIAADNGFSSQSHFGSAFARNFGCTPGQARRQRRSADPQDE